MKPTKWIAALALLPALTGCRRAADHPSALLDRPSPIKPVDLEPVESALVANAPICDPAASCGGCSVNTQVGHMVFVHGYSSDSGAFSQWHSWFKPQNDCAGYQTYRVTIGNIAAQEMRHYPNGCNFWECEDRFVQRQCTANEYDPKCIGHCNSWYSDSTSNHPAGECNGYDRNKNGICGGNGWCIAANSDEGATKYLHVWSSDLASFFWNNRLVDLPNRSVTIVTHSTGAPAVADFMVRGYDGNAHYRIPVEKIKRVINIQAALGGACGVSAWPDLNDAHSDLDDLQDDDLNYDFRKTTYDGQVPWLHVQSSGTSSKECEGMKLAGSFSTGESCGGWTHDGVTNNYADNTSVRHPNGNGTAGTTSPLNITVRAAEAGYCHVDDVHTNYRKDLSRFDRVLGRPLAHIGDVMNPDWKPPAWWSAVLFTPDS
jgi:hypothetical protein